MDIVQASANHDVQDDAIGDTRQDVADSERELNENCEPFIVEPELEKYEVKRIWTHIFTAPEQ